MEAIGYLLGLAFLGAVVWSQLGVLLYRRYPRKPSEEPIEQEQSANGVELPPPPA